MLTATFCHIPGIGHTTEAELWSAGFHSWHAALSPKGVKATGLVKHSWLSHLRESVDRYDKQDISYFACKLPTSQHWRLFREFRQSCAFVDIETTGLSPRTHHITSIVLYDGETIRHYVNGENLADFPDDVEGYRLLVSYNGKCFDVPFIENYFGVRLRQAHIDLRHVLRGVGVAGGLKECERKLGIRRRESAQIDGFMAVRLWHEYRRTNDRRFLETLLAYNVEDAVNLEALMVTAFNLNVQHTPFDDLRLPAPVPCRSPFRADPAAIARVVRDRW
jgi:uncharacterized protein YprB with RNaseH-like and TPR domain